MALGVPFERTTLRLSTDGKHGVGQGKAYLQGTHTQGFRAPQGDGRAYGQAVTLGAGPNNSRMGRMGTAFDGIACRIARK